jgi:hypothetical protein
VGVIAVGGAPGKQQQTPKIFLFINNFYILNSIFFVGFFCSIGGLPMYLSALP